MKLITFEDIKKLNIPVDQYYNWTVEMIKNKSKSILPPKISIKPYEGVFCNVMPSFIYNENSDYEGVKVVTRYPERIPSLESKLLLLNAKSGEFLALIICFIAGLLKYKIPAFLKKICFYRLTFGKICFWVV